MLDTLPLTSNGKIDRLALMPIVACESVAPENPVETAIASIWADVLKLDRIGIHDNFFELGGNSLLATQVISRLRNVFQVNLPLRILFEVSTVAGMAMAVAQCQIEQGAPHEIARLLAELEQSPAGLLCGRAARILL